jgi:hypothetical protein
MIGTGMNEAPQQLLEREQAAAQQGLAAVWVVGPARGERAIASLHGGAPASR